MQAQLQNIIYMVSSFFLYFFQSVDVPWIQHHGFFANNVAAKTQAVAGVGVVQVVGGAHRHKVQFGGGLLKFGVVTVEKFLFGKESRIGEIAVHDAHAVETVVGRKQVVTRVFYGFQVARGNVSTNTYYCEIFHFCLFIVFDNLTCWGAACY